MARANVSLKTAQANLTFFQVAMGCCAMTCVNLEQLQAKLMAFVQQNSHSTVSPGPSTSEVELLVWTMKEPLELLSPEVENLVEVEKA